LIRYRFENNFVCGYQNNYVERLNVGDNAAKSFQHSSNQFERPT